MQGMNWVNMECMTNRLRCYCHITLHRPVYMCAKNAFLFFSWLKKKTLKHTYIICNSEKQHAMLCIYLVVGKWSVTCVIRSETTLDPQRTLLLQTSKPVQYLLVHTPASRTHTIFTSLSFLLHSVHEPYLLHFYCIHSQPAESLYATRHRGCCTSLVSESMRTNWRWASRQWRKC